MNIYLESGEEDFNKAVEHFKKELGSLRTGRANVNLLDGIQAEAYGVLNPLNALANVNLQDGQSLVVVPYDKGTLKNIEKAITDADLGVGVVNEGHQVRINVPQMTEENRRNLVKKLSDKQEQARISVRHVRDEVKQEIEQAEKDKDITEDDKFKFLKELDDKVAALNEEIKSIRDKKEEEIMKV